MLSSRLRLPIRWGLFDYLARIFIYRLANELIAVLIRSALTDCETWLFSKSICRSLLAKLIVYPECIVMSSMYRVDRIT